MEEKDNILEEGAETSAEETAAVSEEKKSEKLVTDQGLNADEYAVSDPWIDSEELDEEEEEELSGYEICYDLKPEEAAVSMQAFQKKVLFRKNMIYTAVLAVLAVLYFINILRNPDYAMGKFLCVFSLVVIAMLWYLPHRHIKKTAEAVGLADSTYTIEVSDVGFILKEDGGKYLVRYTTPTVFVLELEEVFVVCVSKEKMFAVPKRCIPEEDMDTVKQQLKNGLGEKYENWIKA